MKNSKKSILTSTLIAGAMFGATGMFNAASAESLFTYSDLGSGAEVRSSLLEGDNLSASHLELKCGEKAKDAKAVKTSKAKDAKCGEGKCGEGKCGEKKATDKKAEANASDSKSTDAKCGNK